jgi:hypothetical protein
MQGEPASLVVPELHCPVTPAVSPHADEVNLRVARWAQETGLRPAPGRPQHRAGSGFGTLAARVCPGADPDRLTLFAQWLAFCAFYDDKFFADEPCCDGCADGRAGSCDDVVRRARRLSAADAAMAAVSAMVPGGMPSGLPRLPEITRLYRLDVLTGLLNRTARLAECDQFSRFGTHLTLWFSSRIQEPVTPCGHVPFAPCMTLAEIITGVPVSSRKLASCDLRRLTDLAAARTTWCEHIHHCARDRSVRSLMTRLPPLLRNSAGQNPQRAMDQAARICDETMRDYLRLEHAVLAAAAPAVRDYLSLLRTWMRAHSDWRRAALDQGPRTARPADPEALPDFGMKIIFGNRRAYGQENPVGAD